MPEGQTGHLKFNFVAFDINAIEKEMLLPCLLQNIWQRLTSIGYLLTSAFMFQRLCTAPWRTAILPIRITDDHPRFFIEEMANPTMITFIYSFWLPLNGAQNLEGAILKSGSFCLSFCVQLSTIIWWNNLHPESRSLVAAKLWVVSKNQK